VASEHDKKNNNKKKTIIKRRYKNAIFGEKVIGNLMDEMLRAKKKISNSYFYHLITVHELLLNGLLKLYKNHY
jgi:hypothetical protein